MLQTATRRPSPGWLLAARVTVSEQSSLFPQTCSVYPLSVFGYRQGLARAGVWGRRCDRPLPGMAALGPAAVPCLRRPGRPHVAGSAPGLQVASFLRPVSRGPLAMTAAGASRKGGISVFLPRCLLSDCCFVVFGMGALGSRPCDP